MLNKQGFYDLLNRNNIVYESFEHPAVYPMEEIFSHNVHIQNISLKIYFYTKRRPLPDGISGKGRRFYLFLLLT